MLLLCYSYATLIWLLFGSYLKWDLVGNCIGIKGESQRNDKIREYDE